MEGILGTGCTTEGRTNLHTYLHSTFMIVGETRKHLGD